MGRNTKMVAYGLGGIALALAMSLGAFALAGSTLSQPPPTVRIVGATQTPRQAPTGTPTASPGDRGGGTTDPTPTASASPDDHGGGDDHSGSGSGDGDHDDD